MASVSYSYESQMFGAGEGDSNPHEIAPASTSTYSSHAISRDYTHLRARELCDRGDSSAVLGTNASHNSRLTHDRLLLLAPATPPPNGGFRGARAAETLGTLAGSGSIQKRLKTGGDQPSGVQVNFLNGTIHRLHIETESETAALVRPLGGLEYVGSSHVGSDLTPADHAALESRWIDSDTARRAGLRRVDSLTGGEIVGRKGGGDYSGILVPYFHAGSDQVRDYRLRRDHPDLEYDADGTPKAKRKYLSPPGRSNMLYFPPGVRQSHLCDPMLPVVITEGEFKTLGLWRAANHGAASRPRFLPLGVSGVYNWRGTIGKTVGPDGSRMDVKGAIPDLDWIVWARRRVVIAYDADAVTKELVRIARSALAAHLRGRDALVGFLEWDVAKGKGSMIILRPSVPR